MAAILRVGSARAYRILATYAGRNPQIYRSSSLNVYKEQFLNVGLPAVSGSRKFTGGDPVRDIAEGEGEASSSSSPPKAEEGSKAAVSRSDKYLRSVKKLGTIRMRNFLLATVREMLKQESQITSFQAYQIILNCGSELVYQRPEQRIELAHYLWDKLMAAGVTPDVMLYNALISVYMQNNHTFDPMEFLEHMKSSGIQPNRLTLTLLMQAYGQMGDVAGTLKVLEVIKEADVPLTEQILTSLVTAYGLSGDAENAKAVFDLMRENDLEPGLNSYLALLCVHGDKGDMDSILQTIDEMQAKRVYPNQTVFVLLLDSLSRRGHINIIRQLLEMPMIKSLVKDDLKNLMTTVANRGEMSSAFVLLGHVPPAALGQSQGLFTSPGSRLLRQVIWSEQSLDVILVTIRELDRLGVLPFVYETALDLAFTLSNQEISRGILKEMLEEGMEVRPHYFYPIMAHYAQDKNSQGVQEMLDLIGQHNIEVDSSHLKYLVRSFGEPDSSDVEMFINATQNMPLSNFVVNTLAVLVMKTGQLDLLEKLMDHAERDSMEAATLTSAFRTYLVSKAMDPQTALQIVKLFESKDITRGLVFSRIPQVLTECSEESVAVDLLKFITLLLKQGLGHYMDSKTYTYLLRRLQTKQMSSEFYELVRAMKEAGVHLDHHHYRQLIRMMGLTGKAEAAEFCFEKYQALAEPCGDIYSYLIQAYGNCPEGGVLTSFPRAKNLKKICNLCMEMEEKELPLSPRASAYCMIAFLQRGDIPKALQLEKKYGLGEPAYRVASEFVKAYSVSGDVQKAKEWFEEVRRTNVRDKLASFVYNSMLRVYGFHGDFESQNKILQEMREEGVTPNAFSFSEIMKTYLLKDNIESALKILEEAKEEGTFISDSAALLLVNSMGRTGQTDKIDNVVDNILTNRLAASYGKRWQHLLVGLVFASVHAGRNDLAQRLQLEYDIQLFSGMLVHFAENSATRGEVNAVLNAIEFLKQKNIAYGDMYIPLIKAYDARRDAKSALDVYEQLKADGVAVNNEFRHTLSTILIKYSIPVPGDLAVHAATSPEDLDANIDALSPDSDAMSQDSDAMSRASDAMSRDSDAMSRDVDVAGVSREHSSDSDSESESDSEKKND